ncbi:hypothetical protein AB0J21_07350 [Streptomyces sp. NPDC049954]|uniref:hypothetical protein n=1 Tax=Streptomyces sp. NPDC049954 TaxID=3155779 RepID=UPI00341E26BA
MAPRSPAEAALAASFTTGSGDQSVGYRVNDLATDYHADRTVTLRYTVTVVPARGTAENWEFTLHWDDKAFADLFDSPSPSPDRLSLLLDLVHSAFDEWWFTKDGDRRAGKMGRRLP